MCPQWSKWVCAGLWNWWTGVPLVRYQRRCTTIYEALANLSKLIFVKSDTQAQADLVQPKKVLLENEAMCADFEYKCGSSSNNK